MYSLSRDSRWRTPKTAAMLEAVVDPFEPPMPGKITADQALKFAESLIRGEPNRKKIALTASSDKVRELVWAAARRRTMKAKGKK